MMPALAVGDYWTSGQLPTASRPTTTRQNSCQRLDSGTMLKRLHVAGAAPVGFPPLRPIEGFLNDVIASPIRSTLGLD